jgi:hypothetical protein
MRWMVILLAAAPLAFGAEPSEVEKSEATDPVAAAKTESSEPAPDPNFVSEDEAKHFKSLGYRHQMNQGEMKWCRREGAGLTGSRFKTLVCREPEQIRAMQETARDAKKTRTRGAD